MSGFIAHRLGPIYRFGTVAMFVPDEFFHGGAANMVIQQSGAFVKALRMKRIGQLEFFDIDVVAELMTQSAEKSAIARHLFLNCSAHPEADLGGGKVVVAKQLVIVLAAVLPFAGAEDAYGGRFYREMVADDARDLVGQVLDGFFILGR